MKNFSIYRKDDLHKEDHLSMSLYNANYIQNITFLHFYHYPNIVLYISTTTRISILNMPYLYKLTLVLFVGQNNDNVY